MSEEKNAIGSPETNAAETRADNAVVSSRVGPDHALLARMLIKEGKSFKESALAAGYSESVATSGLRKLMSESTPASEAIHAEEKRISMNMERLKPLALNRLYHELVNPVSPNGMKAIEIAGKFKETDWFVRQSETQIGLLIELADSSDKLPDSPIIDIHKD